jgi:hypothetical protein
MAVEIKRDDKGCYATTGKKKHYFECGNNQERTQAMLKAVINNVDDCKKEGKDKREKKHKKQKEEKIKLKNKKKNGN